MFKSFLSFVFFAVIVVSSMAFGVSNAAVLKPALVTVGIINDTPMPFNVPSLVGNFKNHATRIYHDLQEKFTTQ